MSQEDLFKKEKKSRQKPKLPPLNITKICSIGFTQVSAEVFYKLLQEAGVTLVVDIRQNPTSPRSLHTLQRDFPYFLKLHGIKYIHLPQLAPSRELRDQYKESGKSAWDAFAKGFNRLMARRKVLADIKVRQVLDSPASEVICFLCSEPEPNHCHRSLVIEMILRFHQEAEKITVIHLKPLGKSNA